MKRIFHMFFFSLKMGRPPQILQLFKTSKVLKFWCIVSNSTFDLKPMKDLNRKLVTKNVI